MIYQLLDLDAWFIVAADAGLILHYDFATVIPT